MKNYWLFNGEQPIIFCLFVYKRFYSLSGGIFIVSIKEVIPADIKFLIGKEPVDCIISVIRRTNTNFRNIVLPSEKVVNELTKAASGVFFIEIVDSCVSTYGKYCYKQ